MGGINQSDMMDMYIRGCSEEDHLSYLTTNDLMRRFHWEWVERDIEMSTPSQPMRANEQGPFVPTLTDEEVNEIFNGVPAPVQQPMRYDGISYVPNAMNGHTFGETETTPTIPMDQDLDFIFEDDESQQMMSEIRAVAVSAPYQAQPVKREKDWGVRDENTGKIRPPLLYEYLRKLLDDPNYAHVASYIDAQKGIFKFHDKDMAARLWQEAKQRNCDSG